jgi:uncharacterized phiE125 gp8 family phage protein
MSLRLITAPEAWPVSLEEAKKHLRVDVDDDNDMIEAMIEAATDYCNGPTGWLGRALVEQTWELVLDEFPDDEIKIPLPPLIAVDFIKYDNAAGEEITMSASDYTVDNVSEPGWVLPVGDWPTTFESVNAVRIQFRCGWPDDGGSPPVQTVPGVIKAAIKLIVGNLYENRETIVVGQTVAEIPMSAKFLLQKYRIHLSMA